MHLLARALQLLGIIITFHVVILFAFPAFKMGPLLILTLIGILTFAVGRLMQAMQK